MSEIELKKTVEDINKGFNELKHTVEQVKKDALTEEKLSKITDEVLQKLQTVQDEQIKMDGQVKAAEQKAELLETILQRMPVADGKKAASEIEVKSQKAMDEYLRKGECDGFKVTKEGIEIRAMSTDNNPDGGYLVRPELANFIITRAFETSPLRAVANVRTTGAKSIEVLIDDNEADATWEGEGASSVSDTETPELGQLTIVAHKLAAEPKTTQEELDDAYLDVEAWLREKVSDKFTRKENTAFFSGTGVKQPRGLLTHTAWGVAGTYERGKIEQVNMGNASALTGDGLISVQNALKEVYQPNAVWLMKRTTFGAALKLKGADNYFFSPTLMRDGQSGLTLLGKRVLFCDDMPAVAADALSVAYGDFAKGYTIVDRIGIQILRDSLTSKGFVKFYTTKRTGGAVTSFDSFKLGKVAA